MLTFKCIFESELSNLMDGLHLESLHRLQQDQPGLRALLRRDDGATASCDGKQAL